MNTINNLDVCTNCGACAQICPKQCIKFELLEGFQYGPVVDKQKCVECGLCVDTCHLNKELIKVQELSQCIACVNSDEQEVALSTSGGVFGAIAKYVLDLDGIVYGCAYQGHLQVKHSRINNIDDIHLLRGSKYVQSQVGDTYKKAEKDLKDGKLVLYSGTPCQIAGLKSFLRRDYKNLITIDLICHGVPPASIFNKFVEGYEEKYHLILDNVDFRTKKNKGWGLSGYLYGHKEGKTIKKKLYPFNNWYYFYFLKGVIYTEACYTCKYANLDRQGDFTLGDFWGSEKFKLPFKDTKGCSLVLLNTIRAKEIFSKLSLVYTSISIEDACKFNGQLIAPTKKPENYDELIKKITKLETEEVENDFKKNHKKYIILGHIKKIIPAVIIRLIKKIK